MIILPTEPIAPPAVLPVFLINVELTKLPVPLLEIWTAPPIVPALSLKVQQITFKLALSLTSIAPPLDASPTLPSPFMKVKEFTVKEFPVLTTKIFPNFSPLIIGEVFSRALNVKFLEITWFANLYSPSLKYIVPLSPILSIAEVQFVGLLLDPSPIPSTLTYISVEFTETRFSVAYPSLSILPFKLVYSLPNLSFKLLTRAPSLELYINSSADTAVNDMKIKQIAAKTTINPLLKFI